MSDVAAPPSKTADPLERARAHIDGNLFEPLTLGDLAGAARLSVYHFTRQFSARFGLSPMAYVRARRLASAADRLADDPSPALIDLAFDCGFDSQEGFTRAFKRAFGVSPGRFRRAGAMASPLEMLSMTAEAAVAINLTQKPPARKGALRIAGLSALFDETNKAGIPALWDRLFAMLPVEGQAGYETYGVCAAPAGVEPGCMRYTAGVAIAADAPVPKGLEVVDLAPQTYLVFRQIVDAGPLHPQMQAATKAIWGDLVPKSGVRLAHAPDLEFYPADFRPGVAGAVVEWWLPVEG